MKKENVGKQFADSYADGTERNVVKNIDKPAREKIVTIFDCAETLSEALALCADAKEPLQIHIEHKGKYYVVNWIEKLD